MTPRPPEALTDSLATTLALVVEADDGTGVTTDLLAEWRGVTEPCIREHLRTLRADGYVVSEYRVSLPDDYASDMREAETYADGVVTWESEVELHEKPDGFGGWGRVEEWHRCMREIMTAARASMRYTEADGWPEVQP